MKITIESTSEIVRVNGVPARVWQGHTESGIAVTCLITRIAVHKDEATSQFERELQECAEPRVGPNAWPFRFFID